MHTPFYLQTRKDPHIHWVLCTLIPSQLILSQDLRFRLWLLLLHALIHNSQR